MENTGYEQAIRNPATERRPTYISIDEIGNGDVPIRRPPEVPIASHPTAHVPVTPNTSRCSNLEKIIVVVFGLLIISSFILGIISIVSNQNVEIQELTSSEPLDPSKPDAMRYLGIHNCKDLFNKGVRKSGIYLITTTAIEHRVYCDMETDGGGWLVFQRRQNGRESFERDFIDYESGFGDLTGEFWLGLALLHSITTSQTYELRIEVENFTQNRTYAIYSSFIIGNKSNNYVLHYDEYTEGNAGNALFEHNNHQFTTRDRDNDNATHNCSEEHFGGWWFIGSPYCLSSNLNGRYFAQSTSVPFRGIIWSTFLENGLSLKSSEMKIRPIKVGS